jgi:hypothetical protein
MLPWRRMPRKTRAELKPAPPGNVVRMMKELRLWRLAVSASPALTGRDKSLAMAHASMVEMLSDGKPRVHWASNATLGLKAGAKGHDAARVANVKLIELGYLLRVAGPGVRTTSYSYLLNIPVETTAPQDQP